ncbi:MAG TPA: putative glycoside hydrolase [Rectinemataceae bacterium]|nr:putative glycoside hydrolase [Rectinemataceae bacterium]
MNIRFFAAALLAAVLIVPQRASWAVGTDASQAQGAPGDPAATSVGSVPSDFLAGFDTGLYRIENGQTAVPIWLDGEVSKIFRLSDGWLFLTSRGVMYSSDLGVFEDRSAGIPVKTYKNFVDGQKSFTTEVQNIEDLAVDRTDSHLLAACTKDSVYISKDEGQSWTSFGTPVPYEVGLTAVALAPYPGTGESAVWVSHPIKGVFVKRLSGGPWTAFDKGLASIGGMTSVEEVADMLPTSSGMWASNSFLPRIYRWDPAQKGFTVAWKENADFGCAESLDQLPDGSLRFVTDGGVRRLAPGSATPEVDTAAMSVLRAALGAKKDAQLLSLSWKEGDRRSNLSQLWLVDFRNRKPYRAEAENRQGLYLQTGFVVNPATRAKYDKFMDNRRLDAVVVDMKDDFGRLRFEPRDPAIRRIGKVSNPLNIESFVSQWKAKGRYLIARIPVFKDEVAYEYDGCKYAIWDSRTNEPWRGTITRKVEPAQSETAPGGTGPDLADLPSPAPVRYETTDMKEYWVDPYCEDIWAYNVAIANEVIARGFDEVQFDYIRFPTDGQNLRDASYRWKDPGMDQESAIVSFLRYARANIKAPISIDVYGANGWYRSGVRTGQDVEILSKYVDVICPMFYPSHFEQDFLAQPPAIERPYRIYQIGSMRTYFIAHKRVVVRPYVQAFWMNVRYDRIYYNPGYVKLEIAGVRDSLNQGMTFWNNSGRYDDIPVLDLDPNGRLMDGAASAGADSSSVLN